jgi:hypothetical protein
MATSYGASSYASEWRVDLGVVFRSNIDATSSWWITRIARCAFVLKSIPVKFGTTTFPQTYAPGDLLQVDPTSSDEPKTVCEGCYETKNTSIFTWSLIPGVGHYCWLHGSIRRLPPNSKANYLTHTIRRILNFLQLWTIIAAYTRTPHIIVAPCWA